MAEALRTLASTARARDEDDEVGTHKHKQTPCKPFSLSLPGDHTQAPFTQPKHIHAEHTHVRTHALKELNWKP